MDEKSINDPLKKIEELGIREVSRTTHIEVEYINYILDKNFQNLLGKNARGFIKIIEREYGLNLDSWLTEYNAFMSENTTEDNKVFANSVKQNEIVIKDHKKAPGILFWILLLIALIWAVFYFKLYELTNNFLTTTGDENTTISYTNATVVEKVETKLENVGIKIPTNVANININLDTNSGKTDENSTKLNLLEKTIILEANATNDKNLTIQNEVEPKNQKISIVPNEKMWIGVIDINSGKKTTLTTDKEYDINLSKEQLILTGHGMFELNEDGKKEQFKEKNPARLYIKDGKINLISYDEFLKLNKGKAW